LPLAKDAKELKLKGLLQPKYLKMTSLDKLVDMKTRLENIVSSLEEQKLERRESVPNSLKIIKLLLKSLQAKEPRLLKIGDLSV